MNIIKRQPHPILADKPTRKLYAVVYSDGIGTWTTYEKAIESAKFFRRDTIIEGTFVDIEALRG